MRRLIATPIAVLLVFSVTTSITLAGMRVNSISFTASTSLASGATSLTAEDADSLDGQQSLKAGKGNQQGVCAAPCSGLFLNADGFLTGIGNIEELTVIVEAIGDPVVMCVNKGGTAAPGQNPPKVTTSGQQQIGVTQITKNGSASIDVTTGHPVASLPASQMGCPNDNWTASIVDIKFTSATVTVIEDGQTILQQSYSF